MKWLWVEEKDSEELARGNVLFKVMQPVMARPVVRICWADGMYMMNEVEIESFVDGCCCFEELELIDVIDDFVFKG